MVIKTKKPENNFFKSLAQMAGILIMLRNKTLHTMKKTSSLLFLLVAITFLVASCSKPQYAFFGGGPKKLTADAKKTNAQPTVATVIPAEESVALEEAIATLPQAQQQAAKNYLATATASASKVAANPSKITTMKEALKMKREIKKIEKIEAAKKTQEKSQIVALILAIIVGGLGIHRFYLGYTWQGVVQLLTAGGCGIWALIDIIRIATGDLKPKDGEYDKTL
jgi:TM2 domain-containing membrane protein YozV